MRLEFFHLMVNVMRWSVLKISSSNCEIWIFFAVPNFHTDDLVELVIMCFFVPCTCCMSNMTIDFPLQLLCLFVSPPLPVVWIERFDTSIMSNASNLDVNTPGLSRLCYLVHATRRSLSGTSLAFRLCYNQVALFPTSIVSWRICCQQIVNALFWDVFCPWTTY